MRNVQRISKCAFKVDRLSFVFNWRPCQRANVKPKGKKIDAPVVSFSLLQTNKYCAAVGAAFLLLSTAKKTRSTDREKLLWQNSRDVIFSATQERKRDTHSSSNPDLAVPSLHFELICMAQRGTERESVPWVPKVELVGAHRPWKTKSSELMSSVRSALEGKKEGRKEGRREGKR